MSVHDYFHSLFAFLPTMKAVMSLKAQQRVEYTKLKLFLSAGAGPHQKYPGSAEKNQSTGRQSDQVGVFSFLLTISDIISITIQSRFIVSTKTQSRCWRWTGLINMRPIIWTVHVGGTRTAASTPNSTPALPACRTSESDVTV